MRSAFQILWVGTFLLAQFLNAQERNLTTPSFGKGLLNYTASDSTFSAQVSARIQSRFNSTWNYDNNDYGNAEYNFIIRRARLKFDGWAYSPRLKYKIELGLSNRDLGGINSFTNNAPNQILDAVIMWSFSKNWELWAGQTKLPGNVERVVSSSNLQFIDRSILNSRFNIDRDIGFQVRHKSSWGRSFITKEKFALSQGEGRNVTKGNEGGLQYTMRVEALPFGEFKKKGDYIEADLEREQQFKLMLAYTYNLNERAVKTRSGMGDYMYNDTHLFQTDITTHFVDVVAKYKGWSLLTELAQRDAVAPVATNSDGTSTGDVVLIGKALNTQMGYLFKNNLELALRYSEINYDQITDSTNPKEITLGVSKYIVGHKLKFQADLTKATIENNPNKIEVRTGFELHF
ncbi:MAG: porin [Flavobacteriaceae bacterium]